MTIAIILLGACAAVGALFFYAKAEREKRIKAEAEAAHASKLSAALASQLADERKKSADEIERKNKIAKKEAEIHEVQIERRDAISSVDPGARLGGSLDVLRDIAAKRAGNR